MQKEDFKKITQEHINHCKDIIKFNGVCLDVQCENCPFYKYNSINDNEEESCADRGYSTMGLSYEEEDMKLVQSAKEFLQIAYNNFKKQPCEFETANVDDKVWDFLHDFGTIIEKANDRIKVRFNNPLKPDTVYDLYGKIIGTGYPQTLFWNKIEFEKPKPPFDILKLLKQLQTVEFQNGKLNYYLIWNRENNKLHMSFERYFELPNMVYFTNAEEIRKVVDKINLNAISQNDFLQAYNEVFFN